MGVGRKPKIIAVVGPTASGKTALGIELARRFQGEMICVDSRTVYRGMDIGTAKPRGKFETRNSKFENIDALFAGGRPFMVDSVPHWGVDLVDPDEEYNVAVFKDYADAKIREIVARGHVPILVGGTGLWMDSIVENREIPEVKPDAELRRQLEAKSLVELFAEYEQLDPAGALVIDRFNPRRLIRAIEVCRATGKPFSELQRRGESRYGALWIGLDVPREELNRRIDERVDAMIANGLVREVRTLKETHGCNEYAMTGIGYRQMCWFLDGHQSLSEAIEDIKADTRAYAKRQMTWFRRNKNIRWIKRPEDAPPIVRAAYRV